MTAQHSTVSTMPRAYKRKQLINLLHNTLLPWTTDPSKAPLRLRAFSHVASHPRKVKQWVLCHHFDAQLGEPVVFDERSLRKMHGHRIDLVTMKRLGLDVLHLILLLPRISEGADETSDDDG